VAFRKKLSRIESDGDTPIEQLSGKDNFSENSLTTLTLLTNGSSPVDLGNSVVSELLTKPLTKPLTNEKQEEVIQAGSTANAQAEAELTTPSPVEVPVETTDTGAIDVSLSSSKADNLAVLEVSIPTPADLSIPPLLKNRYRLFSIQATQCPLLLVNWSVNRDGCDGVIREWLRCS
jgi:hypothetical protein